MKFCLLHQTVCDATEFVIKKLQYHAAMCNLIFLEKIPRYMFYVNLLNTVTIVYRCESPSS